MKKVFLSLATATILTFAMVACKDAAANDPKKTAMLFMVALKDKDWDNAEKYGTKDTKSFLERMKSMMKMAEKMPGAKKEDMDFSTEWRDKTVTYGDPKIDGDDATVNMMVEGKVFMFVTLKKEDGAWKVVYGSL